MEVTRQQGGTLSSGLGDLITQDLILSDLRTQDPGLKTCAREIKKVKVIEQASIKVVDSCEPRHKVSCVLTVKQ